MFIKDDMQLTVLYYKGRPIDVQVPNTMSFRVTEASPVDASAGKGECCWLACLPCLSLFDQG